MKVSWAKEVPLPLLCPWLKPSMTNNPEIRPRILIVEDHKNIILLEKFCLETNGYHIIVAEDGLSGLELAIKEQPDLILLDLLIPKMDGYLVMKALRNNPTTNNIPILITSAKAQNEDLKQASHYNIQGYLVKPFTTKDLLAKVSEIVIRKEA